ncbi:unnamed protein product [Brassica oleracea var. botrytis]|nr:unnamed protein product [Brassica napus]VDD56138.1 unnamed protein product [Brassica oleracea]
MWFNTVFVTLRSQLGFSEADRRSCFHIEGSSVQPDVGGILEGNMFHAFVVHCNCAVDIFCDGTSGVVYVARDDQLGFVKLMFLSFSYVLFVCSLTS